MTASNFQASLKLVLESEGGNDDDPDDHGGRTSRGVTQREYDAWRKEKGLPPLDVWKAPQSDIDIIYHDEYWNPLCNSLPAGVDYIVFNNNVLDGPVQSTLLLQRALGVTADGRVGPITRAAIASADAKSLISKLSIESTDFYRSLHQPKFIKGWLNRVAFVQKNATTMVST
ncbi:MAG TPA: glycosyl hydrolase 108 family protein [Phyllobacterium sp.]|nr:glycosyl hydrolase 108 family protein [Phyllobacterium sp.]